MERETKEDLVCVHWIAARKAPGIDDITNELLKLSLTLLAAVLSNLFDQALASGVFPSQLKCAVTFIIPKAGKDDYTNFQFHIS